MALPNPGMDAVPFTPLTAEFLDDIIENIESLSSGTGIGDGSITADKLDFATLRKVLYAGPSATSGSVTMSESIMNFSSVEIVTNRGAVFCLTAARNIVLNRVYSAIISNTSGSVITFYSITYRFTSNTTLNIVGGGAVALNASGVAGFSSSNDIAIYSVVGIK